MEKKKIKPNEVTYNSIINRHCNDLSQAVEFLKEMDANSIAPNEVTYTSIINRHCNDLSQAVEFLNKMEAEGIKPDEVTYNSIINKHCNDLSQAVEFLKEMEAKGIAPNEVTYNTIVSVFIDSEADNLAPYKIHLKSPERKGKLYDFHGLMLGSALYWCKENIVNEQVTFPITLIVGKGLHSKDSEAKLKPEITGYLKKHGFSIDEPDNNSGRIIVSQPSVFISVT